ncbi:MAG: transcriptional regulator [Halobacteriota archaeon]|nr:transcriptional regulator [Halobacteriota archaeon]
MGKSGLVDQVVSILDMAGFVTSEKCSIRPRSFDIAARREGILLLLCVLSNIDGFGDEAANELKILTKNLLVSPLLIGEKMGSKKLHTGVIYRRHGIPSINVHTLYDYFINQVPPYVYAGPGGLYVDINNGALKEARMSNEMSIGELASKVGVTRRCIRRYEEGMDVTIEKGLRLEEILKSFLIKPLDPFKEVQTDNANLEFDLLSDLEQSILTTMVEIGFYVLPTNKSPFSAVSTDEDNTILTGISKYTSTMVKRARLVSSISNVVRTESVFIVEGEFSSTIIGDTVLIKREELEEIDNSAEFVDLVHNKKIKKAI